MRATWITSLAAGVIFGVVAGIVVPRVDAFAFLVLLVVFLPTTFLGVFGVRQMKEMLEERKRRGLGFFGSLAEIEDLRRFYLPIWGRMLIWFITTGLFAIIVGGSIA